METMVPMPPPLITLALCELHHLCICQYLNYESMKFMKMKKFITDHHEHHGGLFHGHIDVCIDAIMEVLVCPHWAMTQGVLNG